MGLLAVGIVTGMLATIHDFGDAVRHGLHYFRQLFVLDPAPELMTGGEVTLIFQVWRSRLSALRMVAVQPPGPCLEHSRRLPAPKPDPLPGSRRPARRGRPRDPCAGRSMTAEQAGSVATSPWRLARSPSLGLGDAGADRPGPSGRARPLRHRARGNGLGPGGARVPAPDPARVGHRPHRRPGRVHGDALLLVAAAVLIGASSYAALLGTGLLLAPRALPSP